MSKRFFTQGSSNSPNLVQEDGKGKDTPNSNIEQSVDDSEQLWSRLTSRGTDRIASKERQRSRSSLSQWGLKAKATAVAITMLPVLAIGTTTYYFGAQTITELATQARQEGRVGLVETELSQQKQFNLLAVLLLGTGATALLAGAIAAVWYDRAIRSAQTAITAVQTATGARTERTKLFTDAVRQIRANLTEENVLKAAVEETRKAIAADRVIIYSLDENSRGTVIAESVVSNWPRALPRALGSSVRDHYFEEVYLEKYQNGRIQAIDDIYQANLTDCHLEILETYAVRANLIAPLLNENKLIGLLVAHQCSGPRTWQQSEIDLFTQIATQVGFALDNARLVAERGSLQAQLNGETKWNEFFADATRHIHAAVDEEDILKVAVEEARRFLACDRALVYSLSEKSLGIIIAESVATGFPKGLGKTFEDPCFTARYIEKYQNGRVLAIKNIYEAGMTPCYIESLEKLTVKANMVTPIMREGKLFGLLIAHQCSKPRDWQSVEIEWFKQISTQVGFALNNFQLAQRRIEQAIQETKAAADIWQQEKTALRQQMSALLRDSEAAFEAFSTEASRQAEVVSIAIAQIQAIADSARSTAASAQKAELHLQQATQAVQTGHEIVNKTVDSMTAAQETVIDINAKLQHLDETACQLTEFVSLINEMVAQANRQAINATIESGRNGDAFQQSVVFIAESVRSLTQQLTKTTAEIEPLVVELETQTEDAIVILATHSAHVATGMELTKETRQKLNQLASASAKIGNLANSIAMTATEQAQASTIASQTVLDVANLAAQTSAKSAVVVESFTKLEAFLQEL